MPRSVTFLRICRQVWVFSLLPLRRFSGEGRKPDLAAKSGLFLVAKLHTFSVLRPAGGRRSLQLIRLYVTCLLTGKISGNLRDSTYPIREKPSKSGPGAVAGRIVNRE